MCKKESEKISFWKMQRFIKGIWVPEIFIHFLFGKMPKWILLLSPEIVGIILFHSGERIFDDVWKDACIDGSKDASKNA